MATTPTRLTAQGWTAAGRPAGREGAETVIGQVLEPNVGLARP